MLTSYFFSCCVWVSQSVSQSDRSISGSVSLLQLCSVLKLSFELSLHFESSLCHTALHEKSGSTLVLRGQSCDNVIIVILNTCQRLQRCGWSIYVCHWGGGRKVKLPRCDLIDSLSKEHLAQTKLDYFYELVSPGISGGCALLLWQ